MALPPLQFYFDFISPFGYFASLRIDDLAARHGRTVDWHPMLLGISVMKVMGLKPLLETPLKGPYTANDVHRYAREHGVRLDYRPGAAQMKPLTCGRAFAWARRHHPASAKDLAQALLHAHWHDGADLSEPQSLANMALPAPFSGTDLARVVQEPEAASLLRDEVQAALDAGVFGSPTVVIDGEMFWGVDKLEQAGRWLQQGGW